METAAVHAGCSPDPVTGAILCPIYQSTTFVQESVEAYLSKGYSYSRSGNPTVRSLEKKIAKLEGGYDCCCFSTGMAATCTVFSAFLKPGDHCILISCSYGGTNRAARVHFSKYQIHFDYIDFRDITNVKNAIKSNTKLIFSESPTNPTLYLADVEQVSKLAREKGILHACDSTFATPFMMRPIDLGADMVVISTTKFYDGHNQTVGGAVVTCNKELDETIRFHQNVLGNIMSPQNAFYTLQSTKTLSLRFRRQCESAMTIALFLSKHKKVSNVIYPGLENFPQKKLADKLHKDGLQGTMIGMEVVGGIPAGKKLMNTIETPWSLCENLGACESIITYPAVFTHANMLPEDRYKVGITDSFIRISVGVEDVDDLIRSLAKALDGL